tara:strand:+ start:104 stop:748 length:645 start_codon:yes stop_codon:yes gene_type:complete
MNPKITLLTFTIIVSILFSLYIHKNETKHGLKLADSHHAFVNDSERANIKVLNQGEENTPLKAGFEKIGRLQAEKVYKWSRQSPSSSMRLAQYAITAFGDSGELVVFSGIGGTPQSNIQRWSNQFKNTPDSNTSLNWDLKNNDLDKKFVYLEGTFIKSDMRKNRVLEEMENYSLLAAIVTGSHEPYYFKMTGPTALVKSQKNTFESFIESLIEI